MNISAIVVIRNEAKNLIQYFEHVKRFCNEIIVVDQQSDDNSVSLSCLYADKVFISKNIGYNELDRKWACKLAKNEWVCTLDPDEQFENNFITELQSLQKLANENGYDAISCIIQNIYDGIPLDVGKYSQYRLAKKTVTQSTRIHTGFAPTKGLKTMFIQYHFKNYEDALRKEEHRNKYFNDDRIKNNIKKYYKEEIYNDIKKKREEIYNNNKKDKDNLLKSNEIRVAIK